MAERVLLVIDHLQVGGAQRHVLDLAERLKDRGHMVLLGYTGTAAWPASVELVQLVDARVERSMSVQLDERVGAVAEAWRPTVIHAHLFSSIAAAASVGAQLGIPVVATHHSAGTWQGPTEHRRFTEVLDGVTRHVAVSRPIAASLLTRGIPARRVEYLPNAVVVPARPAPSRRRAGLRAGFIGRLCPDKDPLTAIRALAAAHACTTAEVTLRIAGGGDLHADVIAEIRRLDVGAHVQLCGEVRDISAFMHHIDVLLLSSRSEGTPLVVLEAMGHGRPVIATRVGGVPDQVQDGVTGMLAAPQDHQALGRALSWMAEHPAHRLAMGRAARQRLINRFSIDHMVSQVEKAYSQAALREGLPLVDTAAG